MMNTIKLIIGWLFCDHTFLTFVRNIYGDEINQHNGKRSIWKCKSCGKLIYKDKLYYGEGLSKFLNELSEQYYINLQNKWELDHKQMFDDITEQMYKAASNGKWSIDYVISFNEDDWYRFEKYWTKQNIRIVDIEVSNCNVEIKLYKFRFVWS